MDIEIWDGGLQEQEIAAIRKIEAEFSDSQPEGKSQPSSGSLRDQLQSKLGRNGMFPWKGYAGFRFVDSKGKEGEFDLVIVTHCNVIIVELKDWNHAPITANGDIWFKGDKNMGRSPVSVTRSKQYTLFNKLKKLSQRFTNKGYTPFVEYFVVMTGNADFSQLPEVELRHTVSLKDFLKFADKGAFEKHFRPHPAAQVLNQDFQIFDELFQRANTAPKALKIGGYTAVEEVFEHPKFVYKEYLASSEISKSTEALLRVWNFKNVQGNKAITPQGNSDKVHGLIEGFLGGSVEVLHFEGEFVVVVYHVSLPDSYPVTIPIGFISDDKDVVSAVGRLVTAYVEGSSGFERPNDCGLLSRIGSNE